MTSNDWCQTLGITPPKLEVAAGHREANPQGAAVSPPQLTGSYQRARASVAVDSVEPMAERTRGRGGAFQILAESSRSRLVLAGTH